MCHYLFPFLMIICIDYFLFQHNIKENSYQRRNNFSVQNGSNFCTMHAITTTSKINFLYYHTADCGYESVGTANLLRLFQFICVEEPMRRRGKICINCLRAEVKQSGIFMAIESFVKRHEMKHSNAMIKPVTFRSNTFQVN